VDLSGRVAERFGQILIRGTEQGRTNPGDDFEGRPVLFVEEA
jgi:hypothetical protein